MEKPIAFFSRKLTPAETRYPITELELLAVVFIVQKSRHWIVGRQTTVITDHEALRFLLDSPLLKSRLIRWKLALNQFALTIVYRKGSLNLEGADVLSRLPSQAPGPSSEGSPMSCGIMASFLECADALCKLPSQALAAPEAPPESCVALALTLASYRALDVSPTDLIAEKSYRESRALVLQLSTPTTPSFVFRDPFQNSDLLVLIQCRSSAEIESTLSALPTALMRKLKIIAANYSSCWDSEKKMLFFKRETSEDCWLWVPILNQRTTFVARAHLLGHLAKFRLYCACNKHSKYIGRRFRRMWPTLFRPARLA